MKRYLICAGLIRLFQCLVLIGFLSTFFYCNTSFGQGIPRAANSEIGGSIVKSRQYFKARLAALEEEWTYTDWPSAVADYAGQMVPFLSWWRQRQATNSTRVYFKAGGILMSTIMDNNVSYVWLSDSNAPYDEAIRYLKGKNFLEAMRFARAVDSYSSSALLTNLLSIFQISFLPLLVFVAIRRLSRTRLLEKSKLYARKSLKMARDNCIALGTIAVAVLVAGFFVADGYSTSQGILGSIPRMKISFGFFELPYRWVVISSLLLLLYASFLFIASRRRDAF